MVNTSSLGATSLSQTLICTAVTESLLYAGYCGEKMFPLVIQSDFWCRAKVMVGREDNACLQVISLRAILGWVIWWDVLIGCQSQRLCLWVTLAKERTRENRFNERMTIFNPNYALPWCSLGQWVPHTEWKRVLSIHGAGISINISRCHPSNTPAPHHIQTHTHAHIRR